ncbi:GGDEF domain-containing protein [Acholeplasma hippikon]|uniref:Probable diguanylate cyclase YdaM n=1 Tax=Acholeplasma hippikon TaxID=264636 RepID=A0A449BJD8_9MOLU|nr:GGDEF domain-containing protein [Acholeplasma hippikon]VEU82437.1 Probable diguanylate cyclase YdaM [Acholeplasma hippikon]
MFGKNNRKLTKYDVNHLYNQNKDSIHEFNVQFVPKAFTIVILALILGILLSFFRPTMKQTLPIYLMALLLSSILLALTKLKQLRDRPLIVAYAFVFEMFTFVTYLSIFKFPDRAASSALIFFVVVPLLYVDKSWRVNTFLFSMYLGHLVVSFIFKDMFVATADFVNTTVSVVLGMLFGRTFYLNRLETFEIKKQLTKEKETDFLTGLYNRRKLYHDIEELSMQPNHNVNIMMIDIDFFKEYNDKYGHVNGDLCLTNFSNLLKDMAEKYRIKFYRFGGEEFVGVNTNTNQDYFISIAKEISEEVKVMKELKETLTVSIGISKTSLSKIDDLVDQADKALYKAKKMGRNRIEII